MGTFDKKHLAELKEAVKEWEEKNRDKFKAERKSEFFTQDSGIPIKRLYTPLDLDERGFDYLKDLGLPGEYPYTRGINPTMYRSALWGVTMYLGRPTPEECNKLWKSQVAAGASMISVAYDLPSQLGLDPDNQKAYGEVGRVGVSMSSQKDWEIAFNGIELNKVGVYQVFNAPAIVGLANHIVLAEKQGVKLGDVIGLQQNDILKEYTARGNYIFPIAPSMRLTGDILYYVGTHMPKYGAMTVCENHIAQKGANTVHAAALSLAEAIAFLQTAIAMGIDVDVVAPGITFFPTGLHWKFFEEIAKHRAMRRIYAKVLRERFKAKKPESLMYRIYMPQPGIDLYREQYLNNIGRATIAGLIGALSGAQVIDLRAFDEQFGIPSDEATVYAISINHLVARETGVTNTVDPLAGSYFVESLTCDMEEKILQSLEEIDKRGGIIPCIETGYAQMLMARDAFEYQKRFESGQIERVGVNVFPSKEEQKPVSIYRADPGVEKARREQCRPSAIMGHK